MLVYQKICIIQNVSPDDAIHRGTHAPLHLPGGEGLPIAPTDAGVEGTGAGNKSIRLRLPSSPLLVRGMDGQPVRIVFRMQITPPQVWLQSVTRTKKIPLGQVHSIKCEDIEDGNYVIMALQLGKTSKSRVYLYFVPKQYVESLKTEIIGYRP